MLGGVDAGPRHLDSFSFQHLVKNPGQLGVGVKQQEARLDRLFLKIHGHIRRLLPSCTAARTPSKAPTRS